MKTCLAIAFVLFAGAACAQPQSPQYQAHFESCFQEAKKRHYEGAQHNTFMERCMRDSKSAATALPAVPPSTAPSAAPPATPPSTAPNSPRAVSCNKMASELGIKGTQAKDFLQRCLSAK